MSDLAQSFRSNTRSEMLAGLRQMEGMKSLIGPLAQFTIVVDANILLGDLIWLVGKRKNPQATTELMECIAAGTIVAYVTRSVLDEVNEHIPNIAVEKGLSESALREEWEAYRKRLTVRTPRKHLVDRYKDGQDPDDAPTVALEKMLRADGIFTKDTDIAAMGGMVIELDFTQRARDYSRKTAVAATIKLSGGMALTVSWAAFKVAWKSMQGVVVWVKSLPPAVQGILFIAVVAIASNRQAQERIMTLLGQIGTLLSEHWPAIAGFLGGVGAALAENTVSSPVPTYLPGNRLIDAPETAD